MPIDLDARWRGKRVTVMGLGLFGGGAGAARYLAERGAAVTVTDKKSFADLAPSVHALLGLPITFVLGGHRERDFRDADVVVVNPAVPPGDPFVGLAERSGAGVTREINIFFGIARRRGLRVAGVTGSAGKSTTTALLGDILRAAMPGTLVGGNIGVSLLDAAEKAARGTWCVVELSSFQLHGLAEERISPELAVVTNVAPNHMDWHGSWRAYLRDKQAVFRFQRRRDVSVLNYDDPRVRAWSRRVPGEAVLTSARGPVPARAACAAAVYLEGGAFMARGAAGVRRLADRSDLVLPGAHNASNALAALGAALRIPGAAEAAPEALRAFRGLPHRLEFAGEAAGLRFFNDSKATTPESTITALRAFDAPLAVILGGYDKHASFMALAREVVVRARLAVCIGQTGPLIHDHIAVCVKAGLGTCEVLKAGGLEEAVAVAAGRMPAGGVVLLSPACASWDQFKNYEERGELFRALAARLAGRGAARGSVRGRGPAVRRAGPQGPGGGP